MDLEQKVEGVFSEDFMCHLSCCFGLRFPEDTGEGESMVNGGMRSSIEAIK